MRSPPAVLNPHCDGVVDSRLWPMSMTVGAEQLLVAAVPETPSAMIVDAAIIPVPLLRKTFPPVVDAAFNASVSSARLTGTFDEPFSSFQSPPPRPSPVLPLPTPAAPDALFAVTVLLTMLALPGADRAKQKPPPSLHPPDPFGSAPAPDRAAFALIVSFFSVATPAELSNTPAPQVPPPAPPGVPAAPPWPTFAEIVLAVIVSGDVLPSAIAAPSTPPA